MTWWYLILGAYLLGSIPFGLLIGLAKAGIDVRTFGSGNVGATNVMRTLGKKVGLAVLILDMAKGAVPVSIAIGFGAPTAVVAGVAFAAVCGHVFSIYLGFRGGKGVATAIGAFLPIAPIPIVAMIAIFVVTLLWKHLVSLASVAAVTLFPVLLMLFNQVDSLPQVSTPIILSAVASSILIVVRHAGNIQRILEGQEARLEDPAEVHLE